MTYAIKSVQAVGGYVDTIKQLDRLCFPDYGPVSFDGAHWWFAFDDDDIPVGYAALTYFPTGVAFLSRSGVLHRARGNGLQKRLIHAREREARKAGTKRMVSYTSVLNIHSSNNLIRCGYRVYVPPYQWGLKDANYWEKDLTDLTKETYLL